jgi:hypothetical protein
MLGSDANKLLTFNQPAQGSNPCTPTNQINDLLHLIRPLPGA